VGKLLDKINGPSDLRELSREELGEVAEEIRDLMISTVATTGGHLAASLGAVELAVAIHYVFESPRDKIIWDVGHQSYAHKLLTGRRERFHTLRQMGGISGFPRRSESEHDAFDTGHGSTAVAAALGMAKARDLAKDDYCVVAVVGDGAMSGGLAFEAVNYAGHLKTPIIVILNDNQMSISRNVGALSGYLSKLRLDPYYLRAKSDFENLASKLPLGESLIDAVERFKHGVKGLLLPGMWFEELGFTYLGPIDGHDLSALIDTLRDARSLPEPVVIHTITQKGNLYQCVRQHGGPACRRAPEPGGGDGGDEERHGAARLRGAVPGSGVRRWHGGAVGGDFRGGAGEPGAAADSSDLLDFLAAVV